MLTGRFFTALMRRNNGLLSAPSVDDNERIDPGSVLFHNHNENHSSSSSSSAAGRHFSHSPEDGHNDEDLTRIWSVGASSVLGGRHKQEDAFVVAPQAGLIGVFDGHMGPAASAFCSKNLVDIHQRFLSQQQQQQQSHHPLEVNTDVASLQQQHTQVLTDTFLELDRQFRANNVDLSDGTTACVAFSEEISSRKPADSFMAASASPGSRFGTTVLLSIANTGDSRAIVIRLRNSSDSEILAQTKDHKPLEESEHNRIIKAGGWVTANRRLGGVLLTSRSIGAPLLKDSESAAARLKSLDEIDPELLQHVGPNPRFYKDVAKGLICNPDVISVEIGHDDDIAVIIASDGLWDVLNCESAKEILIDTVKRHRSDSPGDTLARIVAEDLVNVAVSRRTADNTTAVVALRLRK